MAVGETAGTTGTTGTTGSGVADHVIGAGRHAVAGGLSGFVAGAAVSVVVFRGGFFSGGLVGAAIGAVSSAALALTGLD